MSKEESDLGKFSVCDDKHVLFAKGFDSQAEAQGWVHEAERSVDGLLGVMLQARSLIRVHSGRPDLPAPVIVARGVFDIDGNAIDVRDLKQREHAMDKLKELALADDVKS
jgi:hypothetical protein